VTVAEEASGLRPPGRDALTRCVGDPEGFLEAHWSRAPMYRQRADDHAFADLLTLDDVDTLIATAFLRTPAFRMVKDGTQLDERTYTRSATLGGRTVTGVADPGRIFDLFHSGTTLVLQGLHRYWAPLGRFVRQLELALTVPAQTNAYITPPGSQGFALHYDTHDVFVLQVSGTKRWQVRPPVIEAPLQDQTGRTSDEGELLMDVELGPGDCLYLPRGFRHSATAQADTSAHLTIGLLVTTWHEILEEVLRLAKDEPEFRGSLPAGYADDPDALAKVISERLGAFTQWVGELDPDDLASTMSKRFRSSRPPLLAGQLSQLAGLDAIDDGTVVRRRPGSTCWLRLDGDRLTLSLGDRDLRMPPELEPAIRFVLDRDAFVVADLAPMLDEPSRLTLVRRLIREGLLEAGGDA
jgi:lysine-specific demethylase/histidyl-hydroxylase NO66